jgi:predicted nucleotidyltransferase
MDFPLRPHTHLLAVAGSRAFGVHHADSDVDVKGVAIPPAAWLHGCMRQFEQATEAHAIASFIGDLRDDERAVVTRTKLEGTVFDLRKFLRLAAEANPNIIEVLFCRDDEVRLITAVGRRLRAARTLFLSARARHTFAGYATAQLKRIETHRRWLLHPPDHEPTRAEFDLPERTVIPADQLAAAAAAIRSRVDSWDVDVSALAEPERLDLQSRIAALIAELQITQDDRWRAGARAIGIDENFLLLLDRERRYKAARTQWEQYHHWKNHRNAARAEGEARFGYDVKHGAHLYRLLKMCREILIEGEVHVWRGDLDADTIHAIRRGEWPYDRLVGWAKEADAELGEIYSARRYVVPDAPDRDAVDALCVELVESGLRAG